jgi:hypothetical protein
MFATDPDALLRVGSPLVWSGAFLQEYILKLIHSRICEKKGGIIMGKNR